MKVSENHDQIAKEVCTLMSIKKRLKKENEDCIVKVQKYGMLVLNDYAPQMK